MSLHLVNLARFLPLVQKLLLSVAATVATVAATATVATVATVATAAVATVAATVATASSASFLPSASLLQLVYSWLECQTLLLRSCWRHPSLFQMN